MNNFKEQTQLLNILSADLKKQQALMNKLVKKS